jgi:hypothetical protein
MKRYALTMTQGSVGTRISASVRHWASTVLGTAVAAQCVCDKVRSCLSREQPDCPKQDVERILCLPGHSPYVVISSSFLLLLLRRLLLLPPPLPLPSSPPPPLPPPSVVLHPRVELDPLNELSPLLS